MDNSGHGERRRCKRFRVRDGVISLDSVAGEIIDVSFGGISFLYESGQQEAMETEPLASGVIFGGEDLFFENISLRHVCDFALTDPVAGQGGYRRRCMAFGPLTPAELAVLARFIRNCAQAPEEGEEVLPAP